MRIDVIAVGRLSKPYWSAACDEYLKRLAPYAAVRVLEIDDRDTAALPAERAKALQAQSIERLMPRQGFSAAFAPDGDLYSSEGIAAMISRCQDQGRSPVCLIIGGHAGLDAALLGRCDARLSLGRVTLPHQLARVVVLEQVYRAFKIIRNEPYHR